MNKISYSDYPMLYCMSNDSENFPDEVLLEAKSKEALEFMETSKPFKELFNFAAASDSMYQSDATTNYLVTDQFIKKFANPSFQQGMCRKFCESPIKTEYGTILLPGGGQFVYVVIEQEKATHLKNVDGAYLCAAKFKNNFFFGFEEAQVDGSRFYFLPTSIYTDNSPQGGYLAFVMVCIACSEMQIEVKKYKSDNIKESIFIL